MDSFGQGSFFLVCFAVIVFLILVLGVIVHFGGVSLGAKEKFCPDGLTYGYGSISYCKGVPFVCAQDGGCYFLPSDLRVVGEDCRFVGLAGKGGHLVCEEVLK